MAAVVFVVGICLIVVAMLIFGALNRIADAIEAQNKHYGIGADKVSGVVIFNKDGE